MVRQHTTLTRCWLILVLASIQRINGFSTTADCAITSRSIKFSCTPKNHPSCSTSSSSTMYSSLASDDQQTQQEEDFDSDMNQYYERFRKFRRGGYHAPNIHKILLLSDLHMDYPANQDWLYNLCTSKSSSDGDAENGHVGTSIIESQTMIIVAGDVSHDLDILRWTFQTLKSKYGEVIYTPGNHELWLDKAKRLKVATKLDADDDIVGRCRASGRGDGCTNSIEKLEKVLQVCVDESVRIGPVIVGGGSDTIANETNNLNNTSSSNISVTGQQHPLWVIPLLSWHHQSFDTEPPIECWGGIPSARKVVADYFRTAWQYTLLSPFNDSVAKFMDGLNDIILDLDCIKEDIIENNDTTPMLMTFSHFLPLIELLPEKRYLSLPTLHSCVGSTFLEARLRRLKNDIINDNNNNSNNGSSKQQHLHAFGHSHLAWDATIDGVRYIHVPLAYPREWEQRRGSLEIGTMKGEVSLNRHPVCIWENPTQKNSIINDNSESGFPLQWLGGWWSKYYKVTPRQPHRNTELAPWAAKRFRQLPGGQIEKFDHAKVEEELNAKVEEKYQLQCPPSSWTAGTGNWYDHQRASAKK